MLRLFSRGISNVKKNQKSNPVPQKTLETPVIEKKKIKISLNDPQIKILPIKDSLENFFKLPCQKNLELPEELLENRKNFSGLQKILEKKIEQAEIYMKSMIETPKLGEHFSLEDTSSQEVAIYPDQIRSYISHTIKYQQFEGNGLVGIYRQFKKLNPIPIDTAKFDKVLYYEGPLENQDDYNNWAYWYLENQPKEIKNFSKEPWVPLNVDYERVDSYIEKEILVYRNPRHIEENDQISKISSENNTELDENNKSESNFKKSAYYMSNIAEEFLERKLDIVNDLKDNPILENRNKKPESTFILHTAMESSDMLPPGPNSYSLDLVGFNKNLASWAIFRNVPYFHKQLKKFEELRAKSDYKHVWNPVRLPSILNYYEMLPNYYKNHRLVQGVTVCLERFHPTMSRKHKELFINQLCNMLTPRSPQKYMFLQEYFPESTVKVSNETEGEDDSKYDRTDSDEELERKYKAKVEREIKKRKEKKEKERLDALNKAKGIDTSKSNQDDEYEEDEEEEEEEEEEELEEDFKTSKPSKRRSYNGSSSGSDEDEITFNKDEHPQIIPVDDEYNSAEEDLPDNLTLIKDKPRVLSPEQQLQALLGEDLETSDVKHYDLEITDRKIDWFTRNHENPDGIIPSTITFYDNSDGYWDHWIKIKRDRAGLPEISARAYLKH